MTTRREMLNGLAGLAAVALAPGAVVAQTSVADLAVAGPLGDVWVGRADAKVTIIEYASLTCSHCATFHRETWPALKAKYIDTGKARFTLREFPLDQLATAGFMLARCGGPEKYHALTDMLFAQQRVWAFSDKPVDALAAMVKQAGFTQESFESCLNRRDIYDAVIQVKDRGAQKFSVESTPTFFINGMKRSGALTLAEFEKLIDPMLAG